MMIEYLTHKLRHRGKIRGACCEACKAEVALIWKARAARGWVTDPSDPGWREQDAEYMWKLDRQAGAS